MWQTHIEQCEVNENDSAEKHNKTHIHTFWIFLELLEYNNSNKQYMIYYMKNCSR